MEKVILTILIVFVSFISLFAQTATGKTFKGQNVLMGARGGFYYLTAAGTRTYLSNAQKESLQLASAAAGNIAPAKDEIAKIAPAEKVATLQIFDTYVIYKGTRCEIQTGPKGGKFFYRYDKNGAIVKDYL